MAMEATASITLALCTTSLPIGGIDGLSVEFTDVCTWDEDLTNQVIQNPLNRKACIGQKIYLRRNMQSCLWEVKATQAVEGNHYFGFTYCNDECTDLKATHFAQSAIETCNCSQIESVILPLRNEAVSAGWRIDTGLGGGECNMIPLWKNICIPDCVESVVNDGVPMVLKQADVLDSIRLVEGEGIYCKKSIVFTICTPLPGDDVLCIPVEECENEQPVEDV